MTAVCPVRITEVYTLGNTGNAVIITTNITVKLKRNGTQIGTSFTYTHTSAGFASTNTILVPAVFAILDQPGTGTFAYQLTIGGTRTYSEGSGTGTGAMTYDSSSILLLGAQR